MSFFLLMFFVIIQFLSVEKRLVGTEQNIGIQCMVGYVALLLESLF